VTYRSHTRVGCICDAFVTPGEDVVVERYVVRSGEDLGRAIADIRKAQDLTQAALGARTGLSRDSVAQLERGRQGRSIELLLRMLRRLGATVTITMERNDGQA
jgi:DNA-binding XRE family transcriptional regulator